MEIRRHEVSCSERRLLIIDALIVKRHVEDSGSTLNDCEEVVSVDMCGARV